jgi:hypothetical protein
MRAFFRLISCGAVTRSMFLVAVLLGLATASPARAFITTSTWLYRAFIPPTNPRRAPGIVIVHWAGPVVGPVYNGVFVFNGRATLSTRTVLDGNFAFAIDQGQKLLGVISGRSLILSATDNSLIINPIGCTGAFRGATGMGVLRTQFINANFTRGQGQVILPTPQGPPPFVFRP